MFTKRLIAYAPSPQLEIWPRGFLYAMRLPGIQRLYFLKNEKKYYTQNDIYRLRFQAVRNILQSG